MAGRRERGTRKYPQMDSRGSESCVTAEQPTRSSGIQIHTG